jgi:hypothetical protein
MQGAGFKILGLAMMLLAFGCRTPKPNLKPETKPEVCVTPPSENRFNSPVYPKEAFNSRDDGRRIDDSAAMQPTPGKSLSQAAPR